MVSLRPSFSSFHISVLCLQLSSIKPSLNISLFSFLQIMDTSKHLSPPKDSCRPQRISPEPPTPGRACSYVPPVSCAAIFLHYFTLHVTNAKFYQHQLSLRIDTPLWLLPSFCKHPNNCPLIRNSTMYSNQQSPKLRPDPVQTLGENVYWYLLWQGPLRRLGMSRRCREYSSMQKRLSSLMQPSRALLLARWLLDCQGWRAT